MNEINNIDELINFIRENELTQTDLNKLLHSTIGSYFLFNIVDKELIIKKVLEVYHEDKPRNSRRIFIDVNL